MEIAHKLLSSLEKVFPDEVPSASPRPFASALQGETFSFQWAARPAEGDRLEVVVRVDFPLASFIRIGSWAPGESSTAPLPPQREPISPYKPSPRKIQQFRGQSISTPQPMPKRQ